MLICIKSVHMYIQVYLYVYLQILVMSTDATAPTVSVYTPLIRYEGLCIQI